MAKMSVLSQIGAAEIHVRGGPQLRTSNAPFQVFSTSELLGCILEHLDMFEYLSVRTAHPNFDKVVKMLPRLRRQFYLKTLVGNREIPSWLVYGTENRSLAEVYCDRLGISQFTNEYRLGISQSANEYSTSISNAGGQLRQDSAEEAPRIDHDMSKFTAGCQIQKNLVEAASTVHDDELTASTHSQKGADPIKKASSTERCANQEAQKNRSPTWMTFVVFDM